MAGLFCSRVPTGIVADTYSRRLSLIIGYLGTGAAWVAVGLASAPWLIIALWAFWGFSYTFTSGAEQAWITDEVGMERVGMVFLRGARFGQAGAVIGLLLQVAVGSASLRAGVILGGAFTIACGLAAILFMPETGFVRRPREERASPLAEMRTTAVRGGRYAWAQPIASCCDRRRLSWAPRARHSTAWKGAFPQGCGAAGGRQPRSGRLVPGSSGSRGWSPTLRRSGA
jgi:DHA3 family tetracycline resistance protein-like MFS transporter